MDDPASKRLCRVDEVPDGGALGVRAARGGETLDLVVMREGARIVAYHNECPHAGRNLDWAPGEFLVRGGRIVCAAHGATFRVASGECLGGPCRSGLVPCALEIRDGEVFVA